MSDPGSGLPAVPVTKRLILSFSRVAFSMASLFGLRRFQEYMQGCTSLSDNAVWLLGTWYGVRDADTVTTKLSEAQDALLNDFHSRIWCTYRRDFAVLGNLTSDVGWGCTIRSGQMLLAEALSRTLLGRQWVHQRGEPASDQLLELLTLFMDGSDEHQHPFSIHNFCRAGAPHGVVVGQWLGPWVLCKTLEALVNRVNHAGIHVHVVCDPGGGAPCVEVDRLQALMSELAAQDACMAAATSETTGPPLNPQGSSPEPQEQAPTAPSSAGQAATATLQRRSSVLVLVPLTLGVGQINPRYLPQLQEVLTYPQSVGIVGGRPSSSLFFLGHQGEHLLYLDPHETQPVANLPADVDSYFCTTLRLTPLATIDPSLAIGFLCQQQEDLEDLVQRLQQLELQAAGAPLMTVGHSTSRAEAADDIASVPSQAGSDASGAAAAGGEDWEML